MSESDAGRAANGSPFAGAPTRRRLLKAGFGCVIAFDLGSARAATVVAAVRVWPAKEYTRVTLELAQPLEHSHFAIEDPHRVVLDLKGIAVDASLRELVAKVVPSDPYIRKIRVGQFDPQTMRLVFDLKQQVKPQVFTLAPVAHYKYRLVIDLYPTVPPDPLDLLIAQTEATAIIRGLAMGPAVIPRTEPGGPVAGDPTAGTQRGGGGLILPGRSPVTRLVTIAIDPGHGGEDPGAVGPRGTLEKDVVLAVAARVKKKLAGDPTMRVYLTRDGDYFVPLATRVSKARAVKADLFVSIHADAFVKPRARGSSVYVLSDRGASSVEARWLASKENNADLIGGVNLRTRNRETAKLLMEMVTTSQIRDSRQLAASVLSELGDVGILHKPRVEQAGFAVLKAPDVPSILVETAFISNPEEELKLRSPRFQDALANAIVRGIRAYFKANPPGPRGKFS